MKRDIYDTDKRVQSKIKSLKKSDLSNKVIERILEFIDKCKADGLSAHRRSFYLTQLRGLAEIMGKTFLKPTKKDIERAIAEIEKRGYKEWTQTNYKTALKRFYKWHLTGDERYPPQVEWVKTRKANNNKLPKDLPTPDEVSALIEACKNPRDKALISSLADSGCRIGEVLTMHIKDVIFDDYGAVFRVTGKTGDRRVRVIGDSIAYLAAWLEVHPSGTNNTAPLWVGLTSKTKGRRMNYAQARKVLKGAVERSGVKGKLHFHSFRHLRATELAANIAEAPLEAQMGWVHGSEMTKIYVHLSGRDVDRAILKAEGIEVPEEGVKKRELPKPCSRCDTVSPSTSRFCRRCRLPLTADGIAEAEALSEGVVPDERYNQLSKEIEELKEVSVRNERRFSALLQRFTQPVSEDLIGTDPRNAVVMTRAPVHIDIDRWIDDNVKDCDEEDRQFIKSQLQRCERERLEAMREAERKWLEQRYGRSTDEED